MALPQDLIGNEPSLSPHGGTSGAAVVRERAQDGGTGSAGGGHAVGAAPVGLRNVLAALRNTAQRLVNHVDLDPLLSETMACLEQEFGIGHAMVLLYDEYGQRVFTVASLGYPSSGIGSEIPLGEGAIGLAAQERKPVHVSEAKMQGTGGSVEGGLHDVFTSDIPLPGLPESRSQLAVPLVAGEQLMGVLYVESALDKRFSFNDEAALVTLGVQLAMAIRLGQSVLDAADEAGTSVAPDQAPGGEPLTVRHFKENDSIFLGEDYLIKGVAGSIFAVLVRDFTELGRTEFTNRELRLDPRVRLPAVSDNLEGRLILLERRLTERGAPVRIEKSGRGRFRLVSDQPLRLETA